MKIRIFSFLLLFMFAFSLPAQAASVWSQKDLGTIQGLHGIQVVGDQIIAVGNTGNIISSLDGGDNWFVIDDNASIYWQDIEVVDQHVWVAGEGAAMRESLDGGDTWSNVTLSITQSVYDMSLSDSYGYLVGAGGNVITYNQTANLWISIATSFTTNALYGVQDMGDGTAWVVGTAGYLYYGFDGGASWETKGVIANNDLFGVWFTSAVNGFAVGRNGTFVQTTDASASWSSIEVDGLSTQDLYDVRVSGDQIVAVGDQIVVMSEDGGSTWTSYLYEDENYTFHSSAISDSGTWVVGTQDDSKSVVLLYEAEEVIVEEVIVEEEVVDVEPPEAEQSNLIKLACSTEVEVDVNDPCRAVYYYATDGKRHAFTNEKVFYTWFENFDDVVEVSSDFLSSLSLGRNVTYHPGTRMVKFLSVPTVYTVSEGGLLRAISSEQVATDLYGVDWNQQIDDISDAFLGNYSFGEVIESDEDYNVNEALSVVSSLDDNF